MLALKRSLIALVLVTLVWRDATVLSQKQPASSDKGAAKDAVSPGRASQSLFTDGDAASANVDDEKRVADAFEKAFAESRDAIRHIEQLRIDFQTADAAQRAKINTELPGLLSKLKTLMNAMIERAIEAYRVAPSGDPRVSELLVDMAEYYIIGEQEGPGEPHSDAAEDQFYPMAGGEQYERGLPLVKLLLAGGSTENKLYVYGFLAAFVMNDFDLADEYLKKAQDTKAFEELEKSGKDIKNNRNAGRDARVARAAMGYASALDKSRELWANESAIREAEAKADDLPRVKLTTTKGEITLELFENEAPQTVANFLTLVKQGFYDGSPFHRVLPFFMVQGGAKSDDGQGGPGYRIRCECYTDNYRHHFRGSLSMANRGPDTGNSQFFLTLVPTIGLDGKHTVFGRVIEGLEVLAEIERRSPAQQSMPAKPDRIVKAIVLRDRGHEYKFERLPE